MSAYLMSYFTGEKFEDGEQIYFALSDDGFHWKDLNDGQPALISKEGRKGLRDPFMMKSPIDGKFYIIATDLRIWSSKNWKEAVEKGSTKMAVFSSDDLIHWSEMRLFDIAPDGAGCLWAPKAVYDETRDAVMVVFTSFVKDDKHPNGKHRIYRAFTKDFVNFTEAELYYERSNDVIDMAIIQDQGIYYRFYKDEITKHILVDCSKMLDGEFLLVPNETLDQMDHLEGPALYWHTQQSKWCLLVDQFIGGKGYLPMVINTFEQPFRLLDANEYDFGETLKRHGSVINISDHEKLSLLK